MSYTQLFVSLLFFSQKYTNLRKSYIADWKQCTYQCGWKAFIGSRNLFRNISDCRTRPSWKIREARSVIGWLTVYSLTSKMKQTHVNSWKFVLETSLILSSMSLGPKFSCALYTNAQHYIILVIISSLDGVSFEMFPFLWSFISL